MFRPSLPTVLLLTAAAVVTGACSSGPEADQTSFIETQVPVDQPDEEPKKVIFQIDRALQEYQLKLSGVNSRTNRNALLSIAEFLRGQAEKYEQLLFLTARDQSNPGNQGIAVAALGFSSDPRALAVIQQAIVSDSQQVVAAACFALANLKDPETDPDLLWSVMQDEEWNLETRACAAWALHEVQQQMFDLTPVVAIWRKILEAPIDAYDPLIQVNALRGAGKTGETDLGALVVPFLDHPKPRIRECACNALGMLRYQPAWKPLVELLEEGDPNGNVNLSARKALQGLAGGVDHEYDTRLWRRTFERGTAKGS